MQRWHTCGVVRAPALRFQIGTLKQRLHRACLEATRGAVFGEKAGWRGATKENIPGGSSTEEQRSQTVFSAKTLRAAGLLSVAGVGSFLTARCGDARNSPPWPQPKSLAAAPLVVCGVEEWRGGVKAGRNCVRPFRLPVSEYPAIRFVSTPRSSNRTCPFRASGF